MISVVIPIHNEEPAILPLYDRLTRVLETVRGVGYRLREE